MEATVTQIPVYGDTLGKHNFETKERSGLPKSYLKELDSIVNFRELKSNSGVFVDVGGGTGELSSEIATQFGVKAVTIERSPYGLVVANNNGAIGESENMPVKNEVADTVHAKDLIEHLSDEKLAKFSDEVKRILKVDGKLIITEKDYYTRFPFYQKPEVSVEFNGKQWNEKILPREDYQKTYSRLKAKYGDGLTVVFLIFLEHQKISNKNLKILV